MRGGYEIRADSDFAAVVAGCADRETTWINDEIFSLYLALHRSGHAHSLEMWQDGELVGGTYGVVLGQAFFAESMFSRRRSASKIVLAWLMHRLRAGGFTLCDTQFLTPIWPAWGDRDCTGRLSSPADHGPSGPRQFQSRRLSTLLRGDHVFFARGRFRHHIQLWLIRGNTAQDPDIITRMFQRRNRGA